MNNKGILSKFLTGGLTGLAIMSTVYASPVFAHSNNDNIASLELPFGVDSATISGRSANGHIHTEDGKFTIHATNPVTSKDVKININATQNSQKAPFKIESAKYGGRYIPVSIYNKDEGKVLIQGNLPRDQHRKGDSNKINITLTFPQ